MNGVVPERPQASAVIDAVVRDAKAGGAACDRDTACLLANKFFAAAVETGADGITWLNRFEVGSLGPILQAIAPAELGKVEPDSAFDLLNRAILAPNQLFSLVTGGGPGYDWLGLQVRIR